MNWTPQNMLYFGKLGADNLLLILVGVLHLFIWLKKRKSGYRRMREELFEAIFFVGYGLIKDAYRIKAIRPYLIWNWNFVLYQSLIVFALLLPLYIQLIGDIKRLYFGEEKG